MSKTMDDSALASDPGGVRLSHAKLQLFHPELYKFSFFSDIFKPEENRNSYYKTHVVEHMLYGDSRAAVVINLKPLLIAAYTDELDCVAMINFPDNFIGIYNLLPGKRLLTVNTYRKNGNIMTDLTPGPNEFNRYKNFDPYIAEFLSDDFDRIEKRKKEISEKEWKLAEELGKAYFAKHGNFARDGRPLKVNLAAKKL